MKRILVLNYEFPPLGGGASPVSYELANRLSETGDYDIDVVTMGYKGLAPYEEINPHFRIHRVKCWRSKKEMSYAWELYTYLQAGYRMCDRLMRENTYDICHCHFIIPTGVLALRLKKKFGLPYIITSHGSDVPGFNGDRFKFLHMFTGPMLRNICMHAKTIISPSQYLKGLILEKISPHLESKIVVIPNGIDTTKFTPQPKKNYVFSSGRLLPRKGFQFLIESVSDEDIGWEVHIAGDGPMMTELKQLAKKSKTKVILHGWLDNNGKKYKDLLEQAAVYVLASEKENASIALLEAMSAGCCVVTTNLSGAYETVSSSGMVFEPRNVKALSGIIYALTSNHKMINSLQALSLMRVRETFDWSTILKQYITIYV
jgi:glycosyltransferase involved in cell wall biosynthesis